MSDIKIQKKEPNLSQVKIRNWKKSDFQALVDCYREIYSGAFDSQPADDLRLFEFNFNDFPEGQVLAEIDGKVVGYACAIIVQLDESQDHYSYSEITGDGSFSTHNPAGDTLYGADIAVIPEFRGIGIAGKLYSYRRKILKRYNLRRMVAHGRIPGYSQHAGILTPEEYVKKVTAKELNDPALSAHLKTEYVVKKILLDRTVDSECMNYATWLEYLNPTFNAIKRTIAASPINRPNRRIRVCAAQFEVKPVTSWEEMKSRLSLFIHSASSYHSHLLVFPELVTLPMLSLANPDLNLADQMVELAKITEDYIEFFTAQAVEKNLYIVAGSHPTMRDGKLYNSSYIFTPSGRYDYQEKLHVSQKEREEYKFSPGEMIKIFDTPVAKIGIVLSYDIEFPELARLLVQHGVEILVVPFSTDERKSYDRIRFSAHARAVENYCYVVLSGNVGNFNSQTLYHMFYAQSAILTPSDFGFPAGAVEAVADPNTETVVLADLDITNLMVQRETGRVRPFFDQRADLYHLQSLKKLKLVKLD